jgi:hypothetical protein
MSLKLTKKFLVSINNISDFFSELVYNDIDFETLDPAELKGEWSKVSLIKNSNPSSKNLDSEISILKTVLDLNKPKGFFAAFLDQRYQGTKADLEKAIQTKEFLLGVADVFNSQIKSQHELVQVEEFITANIEKKILFGKDLAAFTGDFQKYITETFSGVNKLKEEKEITAEIPTPTIDIIKIGSYDAIVFSEQDLEAVKYFVKDTSYGKTELLTPREVVARINNDISKNQEGLRKFGIRESIDALPADLLKQFAALHANLELEQKINNSLDKAFKLGKDEKATFVFIAVPENDESKTTKVLEENKLPYQKVDWSEEIYDWQNKSGFKPFKELAQSIGTIDKKESDPTNVLGIFFMVFFAFCLNDALYGLLLALFTGYFLYFAKLKPSFKSTFRLFFSSGLATLILGILTNSWAGDFFNSSLFKNWIGVGENGVSPINEVLSQFQIINILEADADALINNSLNGVSPIIFMLILAVVIGFLNTFIGYVFRIINSFKRGDIAVASGQFAWIFFLFAATAYLVLGSGDLAFVGQLLLALGVAGLLVLNQAKSIFGKVLGFAFGPRGLYGIIQLGADLMSYTRIVAIGLTGGVIASIVNLLAGIVYDSTNPIIGFVLALVVLLIGHLFNIALSLFGAYINPIRLTYVEFMPKFFIGEGRQVEKFDSELEYFEITG